MTASDVPVTPEAFVDDLHADQWPSDGSSFDDLDVLALQGDPALAGLFLAVDRLLSPDDELAVSRLGAGVFQDWLWAADKRHPEALDVLADALPEARVLRVSIAPHMMSDHRELRSPGGRRLSAELVASRERRWTEPES